MLFAFAPLDVVHGSGGQRVAVANPHRGLLGNDLERGPIERRGDLHLALLESDVGAAQPWLRPIRSHLGGTGEMFDGGVDVAGAVTEHPELVRNRG